MNCYILTTEISKEDAKITEELQKLIRADEMIRGRTYNDEKAKLLCETARKNWPKYEDRLQMIRQKIKEIETGQLVVIQELIEEQNKYLKQILEDTRKKTQRADRKSKAEQEAEEEMQKEHVKKSYAPIEYEPLRLSEDVNNAIRQSRESETVKDLLQQYFISISGNGKQTPEKVQKAIIRLNSFTGIEAEKVEILQDGIKNRRPKLKPLHDVPATPEQLESFWQIIRQ